MASIGISNGINAEGLSPLNFAFDFTESKTIGTRNLSEIQQESIVKSYINFNRNPMRGASNMWQANIIAEPHYKAVSAMISQNPWLKEVIVKDIKNEVHYLMENKLRGVDYNDNKRLVFEKQLANIMEREFKEGNINISDIKSNIQKNINQYTSFKTIGQQILNPKNWKNLIKSIFTGKKHISIDIIGISSVHTDTNNISSHSNESKLVSDLSVDDKTKLDRALKNANIVKNVDYKHYQNQQEGLDNKVPQKKQTTMVRE
ncbi:hypothetical protein NOVO_03120 [Rickettsiales bacterium Ac37b]|nr:hypothetical protein NOVO_03120 [Rickettsiales bacterium Ac37b]